MQKFIVAGLIATLVMTLVGYFIPPLLGQPAQDTGRMLGGMIFKGEENDMMALVAGLMMHFVMGAVVLALIYGLVLAPILPGAPVVKGVIWGAVLYLLAQMMLMPMMPMMYGMGGFEMNLMFSGDMFGPMSMWSLIDHLIYGVILGAIAVKD